MSKLYYYEYKNSFFGKLFNLFTHILFLLMVFPIPIVYNSWGLSTFEKIALLMAWGFSIMYFVEEISSSLVKSWDLWKENKLY